MRRSPYPLAVGLDRDEAGALLMVLKGELAHGAPLVLVPVVLRLHQLLETAQ